MDQMVRVGQEAILPELWTVLNGVALKRLL